MKPSPEVETKGLRAYEQARAFERLRTWRLPLGYVVFVLVPALNGAVMWELGHRRLAALSFLALLVLALVSWLHWMWLRKGYAANLKLLAELEAAHGDQLPWRQVEKHLAELEQLKRDLAQEREEPR
jgi:type VI protein secretion system component VasK